MVEIIKETIATDAPVYKKATSGDRTIYIIYFLAGLVEAMLAFRLVLKLLGANPASNFVEMIYVLTGALILPFEGIFRRGTTQGIETTSVFEPATLVAMLVYSLLVWGIIYLIRISTSKNLPSQNL